MMRRGLLASRSRRLAAATATHSNSRTDGRSVAATASRSAPRTGGRWLPRSIPPAQTRPLDHADAHAGHNYTNIAMTSTPLGVPPDQEEPSYGQNMIALRLPLPVEVGVEVGDHQGRVEGRLVPYAMLVCRSSTRSTTSVAPISRKMINVTVTAPPSSEDPLGIRKALIIAVQS